MENLVHVAEESTPNIEITTSVYPNSSSHTDSMITRPIFKIREADLVLHPHVSPPLSLSSMIR